MKGNTFSELRPDTARVAGPAVARQIGRALKQAVDRVQL